MKKNGHVQVITAAVLFAAILLTSCMQGPAARKKMPGYLNAEDFEAIYPFKTKQNRVNEYSFNTSEEPFLFEGTVQKFMIIPVPDAAYDLLVADLFEQYKSSAVTIISSWKKLGNQGVIFDLSNGLQQGNSASYLIEKPGDFVLPVIFRWDANSADRAVALIGLMQNAPGINCKKIAN